jgi:hypothetical protein
MTGQSARKKSARIGSFPLPKGYQPATLMPK